VYSHRAQPFIVLTVDSQSPIETVCSHHAV